MKNSDCEINILLGADVIGKLFMNESTHSDSGLSIINTRLRYVVSGRNKLSEGCNVNYDMTLSALSLYVKNASCLRFKSRSLVAEPSLPADRVKDAAVFEVIGIDLAGPLYLKRARRGRPRVIYSDNETNFRCAYNELMTIDWNEVSRYAEIPPTRYAQFIPPTATWWGGFWERIVNTLKELLRRTLGKAIFTFEELTTNLCECEKVVNSRPLTYLSEDLQDLTPIPPAILLCDRPSLETTYLDMLDGNHLRKRLRFRVKMMKELRERFRKEYLGQLVQRHRQDPHSSNIQVGDIVLIGDDVKKCLQWPLARVIELIPGKDGLVRTVRVKTQHSILVRPIQRIFPLEARGSNFQELLNPPADSSMKTLDNDVNLPQASRFGREIKRPNRL
ncbi:integrase catalytic domain-containing protein [Trichonephila clavipes]|nr:integrase catalytic domain-containing protein [Trichonephila clavipes]